jgi:hypothetical protein
MMCLIQFSFDSCEDIFGQRALLCISGMMSGHLYLEWRLVEFSLTPE